MLSMVQANLHLWLCFVVVNKKHQIEVPTVVYMIASSFMAFRVRGMLEIRLPFFVVGYDCRV